MASLKHAPLICHLSFGRRAYPERTLSITLWFSNSFLVSNFLTWRTSSRSPASRFASKTLISRSFFSSFLASSSSASLRNWILGGTGAFWRCRGFRPLAFPSFEGVAVDETDVAAVTAVLRELVETVLLESSNAAFLANNFGQDLTACPISLQ